MTDRTLSGPADLARLDWAKADGLVPVVVQDATDRRVLMVAWADRVALERTLATGDLHFWSRSRGALWRKGETSGNTLRLVSLHADCDADTVLALAEPAGPACHTGEGTCFGALGEAREGGAGHATAGRGDRAADAAGSPPSSLGAVLDGLDDVLQRRQAERPEGSYTVRLLEDENLRLKKLGEETAELVTALAKAEGDRIPEEAADLLYHLLAALRGAGVGLGEVARALESRRG